MRFRAYENCLSPCVVAIVCYQEGCKGHNINSRDHYCNHDYKQASENTCPNYFSMFHTRTYAEFLIKEDSHSV